jgi:signal transduction histidine kinase
VLATVTACVALSGVGIQGVALRRHGLIAGYELMSGMTGVSWALVGGLLASRLPGNRFAWAALGVGVTASVDALLRGYAHAGLLSANSPWPLAGGVAWATTWSNVPGLVLLALLPLLFPDGQLEGRRLRVVPWVAVVATASMVIGAAGASWGRSAVSLLPGSPSEGVPVAFGALDGFGNLLLLAVGLAGIGSIVVRHRRGTAELRSQVRWFAVAGLASIVLLAAGPATGLATVGLFPFAIGFAVFRHRLYDIDRFLRRSLLWLALSAFVALLYLAVAVPAGLVAGRTAGVFGGVAVIIGVALVLEPVRARLQRGIDRVIYGQRDDPYAVLSGLGQQAAAVADHRVLLERAAAGLASSLRVPYVAVRVLATDRMVAAAAAGLSCDGEAFDLCHLDQLVGQLVVAPRAPGEPLGSADRRLLGDVARQLAPAVAAMRLTSELEAARERVVRAREDERQRLRRDLHDGVGSALVGVLMQLDALQLVADRHSPGPLGKIRDDVDEVLAEIRRILDELGPAAIEEVGLAAALRQVAARFSTGVDATVAVADELPLLPEPVQIAVFRIATEALSNAARHGHARHVVITLAVNGPLELSVDDDGRGLPDPVVAGVGLTSMRERAAAVGGSCVIEGNPAGGTRVLALLPVA